MKNQLLNFLSRPFIVALLIAIVIIWFLPNFFSKYELEIEKTDFWASPAAVQDVEEAFRSAMAR